MNKNNGFTLINLLITLSISAILLKSAVPHFSSIHEKNAAEVVTENLYHLYHLGRDHAVAEQEKVVFCGSESGESCDKQWSNYAILFVDRDGDKSPSKSEIVQISDLSAARGKISTRMSFGRNYVLLLPDGNTSWTGSLIYCPNDAENRYATGRVTWNRVGRPYKGVDLDGDGIIEDVGQKKIACN